MRQSNEYMRSYMKRRHDDRMSYCRAKLGSVCLECGSLDNLDIHHTDPKTKKFTFSTAVDRVTLQELDRELEKCVLLCRSCHQKKHVTHKNKIASVA